MGSLKTFLKAAEYYYYFFSFSFFGYGYFYCNKSKNPIEPMPSAA